MRALEVVPGGVDAQAVQVRERRLAGRGLEPAREVARAHADLRGQLVEIHRLAEMGDEPLLGPLDRLVVVGRARRLGGVGRLPDARRLQQQRLRRLHRDLVTAVVLDEVEAEIDGRVEAAAAEDVVRFGHEPLGVPAARSGTSCAASIDDAPVGGRGAPVQEAGRGEQADAGADARHGGLRPRRRASHSMTPAFASRAASRSMPGGRHDDQVGAAHVRQGDRRLQRDRARCSASCGRRSSPCARESAARSGFPISSPQSVPAQAKISSGAIEVEGRPPPSSITVTSIMSSNHLRRMAILPLPAEVAVAYLERDVMNPTTRTTALWEKGDFTRIAEQHAGERRGAGPRRSGITKGLKVLDLGCGDGTTALPAAQAGRRRAGRRHRAQPGRGREPARPGRRASRTAVPGGRRDRPARSSRRSASTSSSASSARCSRPSRSTWPRRWCA